MALVAWSDLIKVAHELTLALRAIERMLIDEPNLYILSKMPSDALQELLAFVRNGDVFGVRRLIRHYSVITIEDMSMANLRRRASCLHIANYTKLTRADLIYSIRKTEQIILAQLERTPIVSLRDGYIGGDGI